MEEKDLLKKQYLTPKELQKLLRVPYKTALRYSHELRKQMEEENYFIPETRNKIVLTKLVKKKFGL
jgi:hypothetical protein|nr:MAG TPA: purine repressor [Caudoviricetes sp.]DAQ17904.1 MAG TPA: purine repressor [Caudoviricetes sp.]